MREIKFRAWNKGINRMFSAEEMGEDELTINPDGRGFVNVNSTSTKLSQYYPHMIPLQYTGLKDKNGKEIYEGDIVLKFGRPDPLFESEVIFQNGAFGYVHDNQGFISFAQNYHFQWVGGMSKRIEVIGNIHENPELLSDVVS